MAIELPADVSSPALARRFITESFAGSENAEVTEIVLLLVSELVTNAVLHAHSASVLRLSDQGGRLRVELHDLSSDDAVIPASQNGHRTGGRGVLLIDTLADRWGSDVDEHGKTVWFELATP